MREKELNGQLNQILLEIKNVVKQRGKKYGGKQRHSVESLLFTDYFTSKDSG